MGHVEEVLEAPAFVPVHAQHLGNKWPYHLYQGACMSPALGTGLSSWNPFSLQEGFLRFGLFLSIVDNDNQIPLFLMKIKA